MSKVIIAKKIININHLLDNNNTLSVEDKINIIKEHLILKEDYKSIKDSDNLLIIMYKLKKKCYSPY